MLSKEALGAIEGAYQYARKKWTDTRPDWDTWFMSQAFLISQRSLDPHTKHGCVIIDQDKTILSVGFNGPPRGCDDSKVPLTRPEKYDWFIHSESAAILNAARHGVKLKDSIFYVTGFPCEKCMREIVNVGAAKVIYGPVNSNCVTDKTRQIVGQMLDGRDLHIVKFEDTNGVVELMKSTVANLGGWCDKKEAASNH